MFLAPTTGLPFARTRRAKPAASLEDLRQLVASPHAPSAPGRFFSFGLPTLDKHLPRQGLALDSVHEIHAASSLDIPAALGFLSALMVSLPEKGPVFIVTSASSLASVGRLHGHGLQTLGLDPGRLTFIEAQKETDAFWAIEETLRSGAAGIVAGLIAQALDLKKSQRLSLAAREARRPLLLLRPPRAAVASAAETRWRIKAAPAHREPSGALTGWRWQVMLERCRNGSVGEFVLEWSHASHRFGLAAALADPALPDSARLVRVNRA
ncbi:ImuA family protein [Taklimakanibacter deserti]|uniref:ImuA family protein n=1 Tax=Taklimakanibacter deserti TaxID=2267839 RepID=UPI000E64FAD2